MFRSCLSIAICITAAVAADEPTPNVVGRLKHPTAVFTGRGGEMFVLDSGAGKLVRFKNDKAVDVVTGYPAVAEAAWDNYSLGPWSAAILASDGFVIGDGAGANEGLIRIFPPFKDQAFTRASAKDKIGPLSVGGKVIAKNAVSGLATTPDTIFAVCRDDASPGRIVKAAINGTKFGPLETWATFDEDSPNPTAIVIHPEEGHVVVGRQGAVAATRDSRLTIFSRVSAKPLLDLPAGLTDLSGLAYSPKTGLLYATDLAWKQPEEAGLYRLDAAFDEGGQIIRATRIAKLDRPTALAFAEDGSLWVTLLGTKGEDRGGSVVRFKAGL